MEHFKGVMILGALVYGFIFALYHGESFAKNLNKKLDNLDKWEAAAVSRFSK